MYLIMNLQGRAQNATDQYSQVDETAV